MEQNEEIEGLPLASETDMTILMHQDAHFGGQFGIMIDYYSKEGKGIHPEIDLERIQELAMMERDLNKNLAALLLSGPQAEKVSQSKEMYKKLRDLYEDDKPGNRNMRLIADLILSESEEAEEEIAAIVKEKGTIVNALIEVIGNEELHDPLFPGYGHAPALAMKCLGLIGDKKAIISLFESIGRGDFFDEDVALSALKAIGEPAKAFLLKVLHSKPVNIDNETAAIALIAFKDDHDVSKAAIELLQDPAIRKNIPFATYLILLCEGLPKDLQSQFLKLADDPATPKDLKRDFKTVMGSFAK